MHIICTNSVYKNLFVLIKKWFLDKTNYSTTKKERSKRSNSYKINNIFESSLIKKTDKSKITKIPHLLETKNNKLILAKFESVTNRMRRFVDGNKQLDTKIYCEK